MSVRPPVKRFHREQPKPAGRRQAALTDGVKEEGVERAGGFESEPEARMQAVLHGANGGVPRDLSARPGEQRIDGLLGALKSHGHAVAGKGRDHRVGIADDDAIGMLGWFGKPEARDGGVGVGIDGGGGETIGESAEAGGAQISGEDGFAIECGEAGVLSEKTGYVDASVLDGAETDVGVFAEVEFECGNERKTEGMAL